MEKETIIFQTNDSKKIEVVFEDGTVWLTQAQICMLLGVKENTITYHIKEIYSIGELKPEATTRKFRVVRQEGSRNVNRNLDFYNFEMIICVGNRVKSSSINQFKTWAEDVIKARTTSLMIPDNSIRNLIKIIRNQQVMLDSDLAALYGVETKRLIEQVTRNIERFPEDFMFQLTWEECGFSRSQFVTLNSRSQIATLKLKQGDNIKY
ncbi:MAG: ORF6N domain-containing protein, partial [Bacteroidales bacterium]|nr:ORF6N domain-containing protein [Bacteroidales bacterium]